MNDIDWGWNLTPEWEDFVGEVHVNHLRTWVPKESFIAYASGIDEQAKAEPWPEGTKESWGNKEGSFEGAKLIAIAYGPPGKVWSKELVKWVDE